MILKYLFGKIKDKDYSKEKFIVGLVTGLIVIYIWNLIDGVGVGITRTLLRGFGISWILFIIWGSIGIFGYFVGFFTFLGLMSLFLYYPNFLPFWIFVIIELTVLEIFFWLDKEKPKISKRLSKREKGKRRWWFTLEKKGEALLETILVLGYLNLGRIAIAKLNLSQNWDILLNWIGYVGYGIIILAFLIGLIYLYIKLNSLRYKK